jgi:isochorismate pyruvate lyase
VTPQECRSLADVSMEIDRLDRSIVPLLVERAGYVRRAADFKETAAEVQAPKRQDDVYANARRIADEVGGDPVLIERLYRRLVAEFIADQDIIWRRSLADDATTPESDP